MSSDNVSPNNPEILDGKAYALLAYLWILCIIPLILKKDNKFTLFHAKQGLVLFVAELIVGFVGLVPFVGWIILFPGMLLFGVLSITGIINVLAGKYWKMPVVGDIAKDIQF